MHKLTLVDLLWKLNLALHKLLIELQKESAKIDPHMDLISALLFWNSVSNLGIPKSLPFMKFCDREFEMFSGCVDIFSCVVRTEVRRSIINHSESILNHCEC